MGFVHTRDVQRESGLGGVRVSMRADTTLPGARYSLSLRVLHRLHRWTVREHTPQNRYQP